jgi:hypothetical protein
LPVIPVPGPVKVPPMAKTAVLLANTRPSAINSFRLIILASTLASSPLGNSQKLKASRQRWEAVRGISRYDIE